MSAPTRPVGPGPLLCACPRCARQWDATGLSAGTALRCSCGEPFPVPTFAPHVPRVARCDQCGAALAAEGRQCAYCSAEITLEERGLSGVCPGCCARLAAGARFCMECGIAIQPQRRPALRADVVCPRCRGTLRTRDVGTASAIECASCAGLWLGQGLLDELCRRADGVEPLPSALGAPPPAREVATPARVEGYIPCLSCGELMQRKNFGAGSGIVVDGCKDHGVWLDHRELERVLAFVRAGGLVRERARESARRVREAERRAEAPLGLPPLLPALDDEVRWRGSRRFGEPDLLDGLFFVARQLGRWLR